VMTGHPEPDSFSVRLAALQPLQRKAPGGGRYQGSRSGARARHGGGQAVLVCHSMGGLIARWFAEKEGGAPLIRSLITIGTPHRGSLNSSHARQRPEPGIGRSESADVVRPEPAVSTSSSPHASSRTAAA
jgi:pimeloyl-ACP methyl ester carboxylesterase